MHLSAVAQLQNAQDCCGWCWLGSGAVVISLPRSSAQTVPGLGSALFWVLQGREGGSVGAELQVVGKGASRHCCYGGLHSQSASNLAKTWRVVFECPKHTQ